jgi:hypothetical protein
MLQVIVWATDFGPEPEMICRDSGEPAATALQMTFETRFTAFPAQAIVGQASNLSRPLGKSFISS